MRSPWRGVVPIYAVIFIDVLSYTFLIPLLPELGRVFGAGPAALGALLSTAALGATLSSPLWGRLSDRVGRKYILVVSQACTLAGYALLAMAPNLTVAFVARAIQGLGGGNLGVAQAFVVDKSPPEERERALALSTAAFGLGFVIGPLVAGSLVRISLRAPFWAGVAFEALNIVLTSVLLAPKSRVTRPRGQTARMRAVLRSPALLSLLARQFLFIFAFTYLFGTFGLYLSAVLGASASGSALVLGVAGAAGASVLVIVLGPLERRLGAFALTQAAFGLACLAYLAMPLAHRLGAFVAVIALWAIAGAALYPSLQKLLTDKAPEERRGAVLGIADSLNNASMIFAPGIAGIVLERAVAWAGAIPAACMALALALGALRTADTPRLKAQQRDRSS